MPSASERYARATEFVSVVRQLWQSFPHDALHFDRNGGLFADPERVQAIDHRGRYLSVQGPLNLPAFGEGRIPFVQAGASPEGRHFAAGVADAVFASTPDQETARQLRQELHELAARQGRRPEAVKLMPGLSLYLAETGSAARQLHADTHARRDPARDRKSIRDLLGVDVSDWPLDRLMQPDDLPAEGDFVPRSRTHATLLRDLVTRESLPLGELLRHNVMSVSKENTDLHHRETTLMRAVRLNKREIEAYLRMSGNDHPSPEDTDRLFSMLKPKSQRNLINAVRLHLKKHLLDDCDLGHHFPCLTKSETDVCRLILAGKKRS